MLGHFYGLNPHKMYLHLHITIFYMAFYTLKYDIKWPHWYTRIKYIIAPQAEKNRLYMATHMLLHSKMLSKSIKSTSNGNTLERNQGLNKKWSIKLRLLKFVSWIFNKLMDMRRRRIFFWKSMPYTVDFSQFSAKLGRKISENYLIIHDSVFTNYRRLTYSCILLI